MYKIGFIAIAMFICNILVAQSIRVTGIITDKNNGEALTGVNIVNVSNDKGTSSDIEGRYTIDMPTSAVLSFSYLGYVSEQILITDSGVLNVELGLSDALLSEIVVTALGLERDSKSLGYAVQKLKAEEISEVKSANFVQNLAGKVAGVTVSQGATGIGSSSKITIRGESSFTNNNPLFVVDGIPINNNTAFNFTNESASGFQEVDFGNGGMDINADDVASISVLKGPSAAALYGTRASNGVIIVTTKDGSKSKGLGVSFNSSTSFETAFQLPQFQNEYGQGNSGQFEFVDGLGGGTNDNISYSWGPKTDQGTLIAQFDSPVTLPNGDVVRGGDVAVHGGAPITPTPFVSYPDNLSDFYSTGYTTTNNIAIANAGDMGSFRLSFTDFQNESIIPGTNLDRKTIASRFSFNPTDKLKVNSSMSYIYSGSDNRPASGYGSENVNYSLVAWGPRSLNIAAMQDYWQPGLEGVQQYSFNNTFFDNPYFILNENRNSFNRDRLFGNIAATYQFTNKLSLMVRSGVDYSSELREFRRNFSTNRFKNGAYAEHDVTYRENNTDFLLNYSDQYDDISIDISVGGNRLDQRSITTQSQVLTLAQPGIFSLTNGASPIEIFQYDATRRINSFYGVAKLGFKDFLYVDITARNDWSSALATPTSADGTSFFYPSISTSLILSKVMDLPTAISFAKLRASWAAVGNDTNPYQTTAAYIAQTPFNSQPTFGAQDFIANENLLPESTKSYEFGADVRLLDDRIRLDATYYSALTENQIIARPVPISSGYTQQVVNGGAVRSKGVELLLGLRAVRSKDFSWDVGVNFSHNVTTIEELPEGIDRLTLAYSRVYDNTNQTVWFQVEEGGRIGDIYGTGYLKNENGDFIINDAGRYIVNNDLQKLGNYNPDFILGLSNSFKYKNWGLGFLFDWRQGGQIVSRTQALAGVAGQLAETADRPEEGIIAEGVVNTGTAESPVWTPNTTAVSAESYYRQYYDRNHEENNTYDASYLKLREFSLTYDISKLGSVLSKMNNASVSVIGRNLFAISDIPHFDPEQLAVQGTQFIGGVEDMSYATSRSIGFKLSLNF